MKSPQSWDRDDLVKQHIARLLIQNRLSLVLGAGISFAAGLPSWEKFTANLVAISGIAVPDGLDAPSTSEFIRSKLPDEKFIGLSREALYLETAVEIQDLVRIELFRSLSFLFMPTRRGSIRQIVSFNFDDLLERYLRHFGVVVVPTRHMPRWKPDCDIEVLHPHGYLPSVQSESPSEQIILTRMDFDRLSGPQQSPWKQELSSILRSSFGLFIGLSGDDPHLSSILVDVNDTHVAKRQGYPFWGVRFSDNSMDPRSTFWEQRGIKQITVDKHYANLPEWLLEVTRVAVEGMASNA